jgi:hypothetical protein
MRAPARRAPPTNLPYCCARSGVAPSSGHLRQFRAVRTEGVSPCSLLIAQRVPLEIVSRILGHSQYNLTMNTCVHLVPQAQQQAANAMDALFGGLATGTD